MGWGIKLPKVNLPKINVPKIDVLGETKKATQFYTQNPQQLTQSLMKDPRRALMYGAGPLAAGMFNPPKSKKPPTAGPDEQSQQILTEQQKGYQEYMKRLPSFQKQMAEGLAKQSMESMTGQQRQAEQRNVSRGLGYGALNEANKEQIRAQNQQQLASAIQQGNLGLLGLGEQMQAGIVTTGAGMQTDMQNRMNQIYQQQLLEMQKQNQGLANLGGIAGTVIGGAVGGPGGAVLGGTAGSAFGGYVSNQSQR